MTPNEKRINQASFILAEYVATRPTIAGLGTNPEEDITDLIADLYHLAQAENIDAERVAQLAMIHFKGELTDKFANADPRDFMNNEENQEGIAEAPQARVYPEQETPPRATYY